MRLDSILNGMEIFLESEDREIFRFPYLPPDITINTPLKTEIFETSNGKNITLVGKRGLKTLTISSFFPAKFYNWLGNITLAPVCINFFEKNREKKLRIVIVSATIRENMECIITELNYSKKQNGDINYSITIQEYKT